MSLHGGDIYKIYRDMGKKVIDYSANINPLGVPQKLKKYIRKNLDSLENYPDPNYLDLKKAISRHNNVAEKNLTVGNGATELIFLFIRALKPKSAIIISPTFAEYERALREMGTQIRYFSLTENEKDFNLDIAELKKELKKNYDLVVFCNPNNPTGSFMFREKFSEILDATKDYNTRFLIDEAFIDFMEDSEKLSYKNFVSEKLIIIRAFTKFFAIPGLRLGYSICFDRNLIEIVKRIKEPWTLNSFASGAGEILLSDKKYIDNTLKQLKKEKTTMVNALKKINFIKVFNPNANFVLIKLLKSNGTELYEFLLGKGFLIRKCDNFKFLNDEYVRVAIKDKKSNKELLRELKLFFKE